MDAKSEQNVALIAGTFAEASRILQLHQRGPERQRDIRKLAIKWDSYLQRKMNRQPVYISSQLAEGRTIRNVWLEEMVKSGEARRLPSEKGSRGRPESRFETIPTVNPFFTLSYLGIDQENFRVFLHSLLVTGLAHEITITLLEDYRKNFDKTAKWRSRVREESSTIPAPRADGRNFASDEAGEKRLIEKSDFAGRVFSAFCEMPFNNVESLEAYDDYELNLALYVWNYIAYSAINAFARIHGVNIGSLRGTIASEYAKLRSASPTRVGAKHN